MPAIATAPKRSTKTSAAPADSIARGALQVQPYLFFEGRCDEAIEFYRRALGAEVTMLMRFKDAPPSPPSDNQDCPPPPAGWENKVMHASFRVGATEILASDGCGTNPLKFQGFSLSLTVETAADAERSFKALSEGGQVQMPLGKTFFSEAFGMVADKFGVGWMVYVAPKNAK
jgi:PhnB protein